MTEFRIREGRPVLAGTPKPLVDHGCHSSTVRKRAVVLIVDLSTDANVGQVIGCNEWVG